MPVATPEDSAPVLAPPPPPPPSIAQTIVQAAPTIAGMDAGAIIAAAAPQLQQPVTFPPLAPVTPGTPAAIIHANAPAIQQTNAAQTIQNTYAPPSTQAPAPRIQTAGVAGTPTAPNVPSGATVPINPYDDPTPPAAQRYGFQGYSYPVESDYIDAVGTRPPGPVYLGGKKGGAIPMEWSWDPADQKWRRDYVLSPDGYWVISGSGESLYGYLTPPSQYGGPSSAVGGTPVPAGTVPSPSGTGTGTGTGGGGTGGPTVVYGGTRVISGPSALTSRVVPQAPTGTPAAAIGLPARSAGSAFYGASNRIVGSAGVAGHAVRGTTVFSRRY